MDSIIQEQVHTCKQLLSAVKVVGLCCHPSPWGLLFVFAVSPDAKPIASAVVGAALGAAVVYAGMQAKQKRDGAAVIDLYNYIVDVGAMVL